MNQKDKKLLEKGYSLLTEHLGEEKAMLFLSLFRSSDMDALQLKELCQDLELERQQKEIKRRQKEEAAKPVILPLSDEAFAGILTEYAAFLDTLKIRYRNSGSFYVWIERPQQNDSSFMVQVYQDFRTKGIHLSCYIGRALTDGVRSVNRLKKTIEKQFPGVTVYVETYHKYSNEFSLEYVLSYESVEQLHRQIVQFCELSEQAVLLGTEAFGSNFES